MFQTDRYEAEKQVIDAATNLMMEKNSITVSLGEVADYCGKSRIAVKRLFRNSDELVRQSLKAALIDMQEIFYWHSAKSISLREKLIQICSDYYNLSKSRPGVVMLFLRGLSKNDQDKTAFPFDAGIESLLNEAREVFRYGLASGEIEEGTDLHIAAKMFTVTILNLLGRSIREKEFHLPPSESVVDVLFNGIGV